MTAEERKVYMHEYYLRNRERLREYGRKWWKENGEFTNRTRRTVYRIKRLKRNKADE